MVSTARMASAPRPARRRSPFRLDQFALAEGWISLILLGIVLQATAWTVTLTDTAPDGLSLALLAVGGVLTGVLLAKARIPDVLAHMLAILAGVVATLLLAIERVPLAPGGRSARVISLRHMAQGWLMQFQAGQPLNDSVLLALLMGAAVWLIAYTSSWALFRRGWLTMTLGLPIIVSVANLGDASEAGTLPLLVALMASTLLVARHAAYRRQVAWSRARLPFPQQHVARFLAGGIIVAVLAGGIAWTLPFAARDSLMSMAWERLQEPWSAGTERWNELLAKMSIGGQPNGGSYAAFDQSFQLGGELNLSDDPVLLLELSANATQPVYLAGQRYDNYDGHGWATAASNTFRAVSADGRRFSPRLSFRAGQGVHLSSEVTTRRSQVAGNLTAIRPKGNLLFTIDTYLTADLRTNVELSWQQFTDYPFRLPPENLEDLPIELRPIAALLPRGIFPPGSDSPLPLDVALAADIETERSVLQQRSLDVRWEVGPQGQAQTLYVTGQVAVYDDVEAVFSQEPVAEGAAYRVTGLTSMADRDQLRAAGTDYPAWLTDRYLQLPNTITDRTRQLASDLIGDQPNVFDATSAVEQYVRSTIAYRQDIAAPPADQDVVDYVLFESQEGYCVYYASAMAVLLRAEGIPTRVVGGYYPAPYDVDAGGYLYREKNAHLWVEVFFPGFGWIPFEPTANRDTLEYGDVGASPDVLPQPTPEPTSPSQTAELTPIPVVPPATENQPSQRPTSPLSQPVRIAGWFGIVLMAVVVMALLWAAVAWFAAFRGLSPVSSIYVRVLRAGLWLRVRPTPSLTPHEYAARVGHALPAAAASVRTVADLYAQELYAEQAPDRTQTHEARAAWRDLRRIALSTWLRRNPRARPRPHSTRRASPQ